MLSSARSQTGANLSLSPVSFADALTCCKRRSYEEISLRSFDFVPRVDLCRCGPATSFHGDHGGLQQRSIIESDARQVEPRNALYRVRQWNLHRVGSGYRLPQSGAESPARGYSRATQYRWGK